MPNLATAMAGSILEFTGSVMGAATVRTWSFPVLKAIGSGICRLHLKYRCARALSWFYDLLPSRLHARGQLNSI